MPAICLRDMVLRVHVSESMSSASGDPWASALLSSSRRGSCVLMPGLRVVSLNTEGQRGLAGGLGGLLVPGVLVHAPGQQRHPSGLD